MEFAENSTEMPVENHSENADESVEYKRHLANLSQHTENKFKTLQNNSERVDFILNLFRGKMDLYNNASDLKDDQAALDLISQSKVSYEDRFYLDALKLITQSVAKCGNYEILAKAYAFRALLLSRVNLFRESEEDMKRASDLGYAESPNLNSEITGKAPDFEKYHEELPKVDENATNCIEIKFTKEFGYHVIASRDIEIGEVVLIEDAIACALKTNDFIHCGHCLELCYNLIPCDDCTEALYCSVECKNESFRKYHKYECAIVKNFEIDKDRSLYVPIRLTLMILGGAFANNFLRVRDIRKLSTNFPKRPVKEVMSFAELSAEIFSSIKIRTSFFEENRDKFSGNEIEREFKETLMTQLMVFTINSVESPEVLIPFQDCNYSKIVGCGVYPIFSNFNHSCNPKIFRYFHGSTIILRSIATISKGEQCFITYGPRFDYKPKSRRQQILRHYHFECLCEACVEDWPMINEMNVQFPNCSKDFEYIELKEKVKSGNRQNAKAILSKLIQELENCEKSKNLLTLTYLRFILREYYALLGNRREIIN